MASNGRFASQSETHLPITPEQKRKRVGETNTKPRHSQERNGNSRASKDKECHRGAQQGKASFARDWPFPRRERSSCSPPHESQRHSVDRFFESRDRGEHPPPYQPRTAPEASKQAKHWRRRSFPKRLIRHHSDHGRGHNQQPVAGHEPAASTSSRSGIEQEWSKLRVAQDQVRRDRQALGRDKAAHEARVRYELEQLGRDVEEERSRFGGRENGEGCRDFPARSPWSEEKDDDYSNFCFGVYEYPSQDEYWAMCGGVNTPVYEDEEDVDVEEEGFENWDTDEEESYEDSAYQAYFHRLPPPYMCSDFDEGETQNTWDDNDSRRHKQPRFQQQTHKCKDVEKAYEAYIDKWKTTPTTDPSIPYPTTDLSSNSLLAPPDIGIDVALSEDQTIEFNTTTFFLLAFNMRPDIMTNTAGTPKIELCPRADLNQVRALQKQMKIERIRWHPDSLLKRRADGMVKETESKGVYRAVDELLEECKVRLGRR